MVILDEYVEITYVLYNFVTGNYREITGGMNMLCSKLYTEKIVAEYYKEDGI